MKDKRKYEKFVLYLSVGMIITASVLVGMIPFINDKASAKIVEIQEKAKDSVFFQDQDIVKVCETKGIGNTLLFITVLRKKVMLLDLIPITENTGDGSMVWLIIL